MDWRMNWREGRKNVNMQSKKENINLARGGRDLGWGNNIGDGDKRNISIFYLDNRNKRVKAGNVAGVQFFVWTSIELKVTFI